MPQPQIARSLFMTERPKCPNCDHRMALEMIEPYKPDHDRRTFECPSCEHVETVVSDIIGKLCDKPARPEPSGFEISFSSAGPGARHVSTPKELP